MLRFAVRRVVLVVPVLVAVTFVTFLISHVVPGDPARMVAGINASQEQVARLHRELGLDRSLPQQYWIYMKGLVRGDLGTSFVNQQPVASNLREFFPATLELAVAALAIAIVVGLPLGVLAAAKAGRLLDHASRVVSVVGVTLPVFVFGIVLVYLLYYRLGWFPSGGRVSLAVLNAHPLPTTTGILTLDALVHGNLPVLGDALRHLFLPAFTLSLGVIARLVRTTRTTMIEVLRQDYIRAARAKGAAEWRVVWHHAFRNAAIPAVTILGISFGYLLGGAVLVETVFAWPGIGSYAFQSIKYLDYNSIQGITLVATFAFVGANLACDLVYALLDPRTRTR